MSFRRTTREPWSGWRISLIILVSSTVVPAVRAEDPVPPPAVDPAAKFRIDKDRLIFAGIKDDERVQSEAENNDEFLSYNEVFTFAHQFSAAELEANARRDVSYRDLMSRTRDEFKLDLVFLEGRLLRVLRREPTPTLAAAGFSAFYEGWLVPKDETEPVCIVFSELPPEITPAKDLVPQPWVQFAGYVFKVMRYEAQPDFTDPGRGKMRRAPLLIGQSVTVIPTPVRSPGADWHGTFVPALLIGLGGLSAIGFGLAWWYRRGDRAVRAVLAGRAQQNPFAAVE
jgi:hypothetical protein